MHKRKVRIVSVPEMSKLPDIAALLIGFYARKCDENNRESLHFSVDMLPKSLNHQYNKSTFGGKVRVWLHEDIKALRELVAYSLGPKRFQWRPQGVTAAVVLFYSPLWIMKTRQVRKMDADNKVKPLFDAVELATGVPDELNWHVHAIKVPSKTTRTVVHLFDLGDVVEFHG